MIENKIDEDKNNKEKDDKKIKYLSKYLSKIFYVLSNDKRFKIVSELNKQSRNVTELESLIEEDQENTSHHLTILRKNGIVSYEKKGSKNYYRLSKDFLDHYTSRLILEDFPTALIEIRKLI
jgi:DNA-binding transcriptional ArsR family regulator